MKYALSPCGVAVPPSKPAINEARLRIPEDISIINGCDSDLAELATPPITVIRKDFQGMGTVAAQLLLERLGEAQPKKSKSHRIMIETIH